MYPAGIKRRMQFDSPQMSKKSQIKKLVFDQQEEEMNSPLKISQPRKLFVDHIDENSCGSAFSEHDSELDDLSQSSDLDTSFNFSTKPISETSPPKPNLESPFSRFRLNNHQELSTNEKLIGDMSRTHTLPILTKSRHNDLASIEPKTLVDLLNGEYDDKIGRYIILDARYPYEYNGGHVSSAQSAYVKEELMEQLFHNPITTPDGKPVVVIFHCEFSIERGPKLMREFREKDRSLNQDSYPNLFYPEIYLLEGGYKRFYEESIQHCEPKSYMPMSDNDHKQDMKYFRKKSKSWEMYNRKPRFTIKAKLDF